MSALAWDTTSVQNRLKDRLRASAAWASLLTDGASPRLLECVGDEFALLAEQDEFLTRERKWSTARNSSSLVAGAKGFNYDPHRQIGATGYVTVSSSKLRFSDAWNSYATYDLNAYVTIGTSIYKSLQSTNSNHAPASSPTWWQLVTVVYTYNIGIPQWSMFTGSSGLSYVSIQATNLSPSQNSVEVPIVQGVLKTATFASQGIANEEFFISDPNVDNVFYSVYVNGIVWSEVSDLLTGASTDKVYETDNDRAFAGVYVRFGDSVNGLKLTAGDTITVQYVMTNGSAGNVTGQAGITTVSSSITDINGTVVPLYCSNLNAVVGGQDYENKESIRINAPLHLQSGNSLSYPDGLASYLRTNFSFIGQCVIWGAYEKNVDAGLDPSTYIPVEQNYCYIAAITPGTAPLDILKNLDGTANNTYKNQILTATQGRKGFTDLYSFQNVEFIFLNLVSAVTVYDSAPSLSGVVSAVQTGSLATFGVDKWTFKTPIYSSDLNTFVSSIPQVHHHTSYLEGLVIGTFITSPTLPFTLSMPTGISTLQLWAIRANSVRVMVVDTFGVSTTIAVDNGAGGFTAQNGVTISSGTITYATGAITLTISAGLSTPSSTYAQVKVYYRPAGDDIVPKTRTQILYLKESNVTAVYL